MDCTRRDLLRTAWPWRALAWTVTGVPVGAAVLLCASSLIVLGVVGLPLLIGLAVLAGGALLGLPVGALERRRLRWTGIRVEAPHRDPDRPGLTAWLRCRFGEAATWRELAHAATVALAWPIDLMLVVCLVGAPLSLLTAPLVQLRFGEVKILKVIVLHNAPQAWAVVPVGVLALVASAYMTTAYVQLRAAAAAVLLGRPDDEVRELVDSRARLADAFDAERRRIERNLHDGAQQRLVSLGMTLGLARIADPVEVPQLVAKAHTEAERALDELRELSQGIHPRILVDRGLPAALEELADRSLVPVSVEVDLPRRLPERVEACAYFVVAEALANVAKHSGASQARVEGVLDGDRLVLHVTDDGTGGADFSRGTGLVGLADRVAAADGRLALASPPGGPTALHLELPCR